MELSLFPLNTVLFPGGVLPLRIFEPRYLDMISRCMRNHTGFGICLIQQGTETGEAAAIYPVGTMAKIVDWERLPDGLLGVTAQCEHKIQVVETHTASDNLLIGEVEMLADEPERELPGEFQSLSDLLERIVEQIGGAYGELPAHYSQAGWVGARLTELLPLELSVKQQLLEIDDPLVRLFQLRDAMINTPGLGGTSGPPS